MRQQEPGPWLDWSSYAVVCFVLLLAALHVSLTKSEVTLGLARLLERRKQKKHMTHELDSTRQRFEEELLKVRMKIWGMNQSLGIHLVFLVTLATIHKLMSAPSGADGAALLQFLGPLLGYALHASIQAGIVELKSNRNFCYLEAVYSTIYAIYLCGIVNETEFEVFCAMEKISQVTMILLSVSRWCYHFVLLFGLLVTMQNSFSPAGSSATSWSQVIFIDLTMAIPIYLTGAVVLSYKQWQWIGFSKVTPMLISSTLISHIALAAVVSFIVYAMQSSIAAKLESDDASSLLKAFREIFRGICDGNIVLDPRNYKIVGDATSLEYLLKAKTTLADTNFLDLFSDFKRRQRFVQFLQSESAKLLPRGPGCPGQFPPCLRIALEGAEGPVSTDVFCTSCVAGQDYYLLAFRADPEQFLAPPDAYDAYDAAAAVAAPQAARPSGDPPQQHMASSREVVDAVKELVQVTLLVNNDTASLDIEEATLSFERSRQSHGMPTLRSLVKIEDWQPVEQIFRDLAVPVPTADLGQAEEVADHPDHPDHPDLQHPQPPIFHFPSSLFLRVPGSRPTSYLCANDVAIGVAEELGPGEVAGKFEVQLSGLRLRHRRRKEQDLESISEDG